MTVFSSLHAGDASSPSTSATRVFHTGLIFGWFSTRSAMIFDARSASRRWIRRDLAGELREVEALLHRRVAAANDGEDLVAERRERAVADGARGHAAAQLRQPFLVRHAQASSRGRPSRRSRVSASISSLYDGLRRKGCREKSTDAMFSCSIRVPNRTACSRNVSISSGPVTPSRIRGSSRRRSCT